MSTVNANSSHTPEGSGGAALVNSNAEGPFSVGASIVYNNMTGATPVVRDCFGIPVPPVTDLGHNLSDYDVPGTPATNSCGFTQPPDILVPVGTNIGLGPLGAYGGPTLGAPGATSPTFTERLLAGSPAIDGVPTTIVDPVVRISVTFGARAWCPTRRAGRADATSETVPCHTFGA